MKSGVRIRYLKDTAVSSTEEPGEWSTDEEPQDVAGCSTPARQG